MSKPPSAKGPGSNQWQDKPPATTTPPPTTGGQQAAAAGAAGASPFGQPGPDMAKIHHDLSVDVKGLGGTVSRNEVDMMLAGKLHGQPSEAQVDAAANYLTECGMTVTGTGGHQSMSQQTDQKALAQHGTVEFDPPTSSADQVKLALLDHGNAEAGNVQSVRKARYDARVDLAEAFGALEGQQGMTKAQQVDALRTAADRVMDAAMKLQAAAAHAEQRDLDAHLAKKMQAGPGAVASLSGDGYITPEQQESDAAGWAAQKQTEDVDMDDELKKLLGDQ